MRKALATLALAAIPAIAMTACNGPSNGVSGSALPNTAQFNRIRPHDFSSAYDLHAGGATFPAYAYNLGSQPAGLGTNPQAPPGTGSLFGSIKLPGNGNVYYCLTGSGTGRGIFATGSKGQSNGTTATTTGACAPLGATPSGFGARIDPPDFAASDVALSSTDYTNYKNTREPSTGTSWGEPLEVPVIGGPIVYGYRTQDFKAVATTRIHLATWTFCAIANGTIDNWNDPAITRDNGGVSVTKGVSEPITFYFRSDGSGTSYNFTYHLAAICGTSWHKPYNKAPYESSGHSAAWTFGFSQTWPGPGSASVPNAHFIGASGNPGVLAAVQSTPFGVGYLEGAWAKSANPSVGQTILQAGTTKRGKPVWSDPTNAAQTTPALSYLNAASITYGGGSDALPLGTTRPECALYIDPSKFTSPLLHGAPAGTYPVNAISYLLFYGKNNGVRTASKLHLLYFLTSSKAKSIEAGFEYTPLSSGIMQAVRAAVKGSNGKAPCLQ